MQQDPQEFSKLFMAMVEECVSAEGAPPGTTDARDDADNLVAELFRGFATSNDSERCAIVRSEFESG